MERVTIYGGTNTTVPAEVCSNQKALYVSGRPVNYTNDGNTITGGYYRVAKSFSLGAGATIAANAAVFSFRWVSSTLTALVTTFKWNWVQTANFTGAQTVDHQAFIARGFTSNDSGTGSSTLTTSTNQMKHRTSMSTSVVGEIRYATTNTLTAGTRTLDSTPFAYKGALVAASNVGAYCFDGTSIAMEVNREHPITLAQDEGVVLNNITVFPAAGTINLYVEMAWAEVPNANF